ncbi:MAG: aminotransferase class I/II-fold pyridoxal phosphate-dependent enzyme [Rikenellaceae bacterium]|nr:aminotransferase class I/II-fold pyridoxal phosphate-dependent enzyme [Rikenellaceae bacterium]
MSKPIQLEVADRLGQIREYYFSKKLREIDEMRAAGREIISLGVGGPDQPPHPSVVERLSREAAKPNTHSYQPYKGTAILREAFASWYAARYGVTLDPVNEILPLIGSKEGLMHICMTYLNPGDRVLIPNPGYPTYRSAATIAGGVCVDYRLTAAGGWMPDFEALEQSDLRGVKMMLVNYPQMPTGARPTREMFARLVDFAARHGILLVHDNPYSFVRNDDPLSLLATPGAMDVAIELNSLSKSHNMAGWRIGMIGAARERIDQIIRFKSNMDSGMFYPMQAAAAEALALGDDWYRSLNELYYSREAKGTELLDVLGCSYQPHQSGLFIWARIPEGAGDCYTFADRILDDCGVFVTPGGIFGSEGNDYIRISLCSPVEMLDRAINKIKQGMQ